MLFLPEGHAPVGGAVLPEAAGVEGDDVVQEVRQRRDLPGLVPGQHAEVVVPKKRFKIGIFSSFQRVLRWIPYKLDLENPNLVSVTPIMAEKIDITVISQ